MSFFPVRKNKPAASSPHQVTKSTADEVIKELVGEPTPTDPKVDAAAVDRLITARITLLLRKPFFGNLATRLVLRNADEWCPTAATDGKYFYYNAKFIMKLKPRELEFLVGHEVLHVVYDHMGRRGDRNPQLWNIANDYAVNYDLVEQKVGELITTVGCLYDKQYADMASEEIYNKLRDEMAKNGGASGQGPSEDGKGGKTSGGETLDDLLDKVIDQHLSENGDGEGEDGEGGNGQSGGKGKGKGGPVPMTPEERKALKDQIKEAVLQAAESAGAGNVPGGVKRLINELTEPKISWQELIAQQIESTIKADFSWMRPSRRGWHMDAVMPGMTPGQTIDVCVAIDTSGSISGKMLQEFLSEVQGIMEQYEDYNVHVWCFDTAIHNPEKFTSDNMREIAEYEPAGFGGTDFDANWEWMKEEGIEPKKFIVFTDGYPFGSWGDPDYCETVWIISGSTDITPPFGIWAYYDEQ